MKSLFLLATYILVNSHANAGSIVVPKSPDFFNPPAANMTGSYQFLYDLNQCEELAGNAGQQLTCGSGKVAIGACGSGRDADCQGKVQRLRCCTLKDTKMLTTNKRWVTGMYGKSVSCSRTEVVTGNCGSGSGSDCKINNVNVTHAIQCTEINLPNTMTVYRNDNINFHGGDWRNGVYGQNVDCQPHELFVGACGSGQDADCGSNTWHKVRCVPVISK